MDPRPFFDELVNAWGRSQDTFWPRAVVSLSLTLHALGVVLLLGLPLGVLLTRVRLLAKPVTEVLALVQTVPSVVLLALLLPFLGLGQTPALAAAVIYSLYAVVLNTYTGINTVSPAVRDAARGMGMTSFQVLCNVELPLALPVILAGVRTAVVACSGMIVIGAFIGAGGLGDYVYNGMSRADTGLIWVGALPVLVLTFALLGAVTGLERLARLNYRVGLSVGGLLIVGLSLFAVYGLGERAFTKRQPNHLIVGARDFTEGQILAEIVKQQLEAHTKLEVTVRSQLPTSVSLKAIKNDELDLYPEYMGNLLTNKDGLDLPVPEDKSTITPLVREEMRRRFGLVVLDEFGLNNTYTPCVTRATAARYNLHKISDLHGASKLRVVVDFSFLTRPDGWPGLIEKYDLHFDKTPQQVSPDLLYRALEQNEADLVMGFATDWQIEKMDLVVLEDDKNYFPSYHAAPVVRAAVLQQHPEVAEALHQLAGRIDDRTMRRLNYQVAVEKRSEVDVARAFLREQGLIDK